VRKPSHDQLSALCIAIKRIRFWHLPNSGDGSLDFVEELVAPPLALPLDVNRGVSDFLPGFRMPCDGLHAIAPAVPLRHLPTVLVRPYLDESLRLGDSIPLRIL